MDVTTDLSKLVKAHPVRNDELFLLQPCTIICGQTKSGKTMLLQNLLFKTIFAQVEPENTYIFSRTVMRDKAWQPYLEFIANRDNSLLFQNIHSDFKALKVLCKEWDQEAIMDPDNIVQRLVILDDMIGARELSSYSSWLSNYIPICRHSGVSFIILTQKWNALSTTIRQQCGQAMVGFCSTGLKSFIGDIQQLMPERDIIQMYLGVVANRDDYNFLVVRKDKPYNNGFFRRNFDTTLEISQHGRCKSTTR